MEKIDLKTLELGNVLEKLKKIDIRAWYFVDGCPSTEVNGIMFTMYGGGLSIKDQETGSSYYYSCDKKDEDLKKSLIKFYTETYNSLNEHHKAKLEEKLESFLSE